MAQRRMIAKKITQNKKLAQLKSPWAKLMFTWMIPYADDYGRLPGDTDMLKALIFPREHKTLRKIGELRDQLEEIGLIKIYEVDGSKYIQLLGFDEYQTFKSDRPRQKEYPDTPNGNPMETKRKPEGASSQVKLSKVKKESVQSDHIDHNILCKELSTDRLTDSFKKQICKTKTFKAFCELMEVRGWCMDRDLCTGIIKEVWAKVKKKKPKNLMGYMNGSLKNYVLEHADEINEKVKRLRGDK